MTGRPRRVGELLAAAVPELAGWDAPDLGAALPLPALEHGEAPLILRCGCGSNHGFPPGVRSVYCWVTGWWVSRNPADAWRPSAGSLFQRWAAAAAGR